MFSGTIRKILLFGAGFAALWLATKYLLPIAMPFLLAFLLALASEPLVRFFHDKAHLPRAAATGLGLTISLTMLVLAAMVLGALLVRELGTLANVLPDLEGTATQGMSVLQAQLLHMAQAAPKSVRPVLTRSVESLFSDGTAIMESTSSLLLNVASGVVTRLPDSALGIGTWILASFMLSAKLPRIRRWVRSHLPPAWHETYLPMLRQLKKAVLGWLFAQVRLVGVTFLVLTAGFFILRITYAPLWAALISLVDALPILGTGTVLVPWSLVCFLQGDYLRAVGLLGVYAVASLLRSVLEPRLVGKQLGLDPLITLAAMYAGYRLWGVPGMLFSPLAAVTAIQIFAAEKRQ